MELRVCLGWLFGMKYWKIVNNVDSKRKRCLLSGFVAV